MKIKPDVNLKELCKDWTETDEFFKMTGPFDEFCVINKTTREVQEEGYSLMFRDWVNIGVAEY